MAYRSTYTGRYSGLGRMIRRESMQRPCLRAAEKIRVAAEANSPVGDPLEDAHPGLYKRSFVIGTTTKNAPFRGRPAVRHIALVINRTPYSLKVEFGDGKTPEYAPLRKAIDATTIYKVETGTP